VHLSIAYLRDMHEIIREAGELIHQDISLEQQEKPDDYQELLEMIENRVLELMEKDDRLLFSYLYRLDISEQHLIAVMNATGLDKIHAIAKLILDRQLIRLKTKKQYPQTPIDGWEW